MDPISIAMGVVGLGMQIFGAVGSADVSKQQSQVSKDEAQQEQGINNRKQQAMETDARRQSLEIMRRNQQAQALAQTRATNQGAQFGSGLQGGLAEVDAASTFNLQGINNALETGRGINSLNQNISADKMKMADLGADAASYAGWSSLGGALIKAGPIAGQIFNPGTSSRGGGLAAGGAFNNSGPSNFYGPLN